MQHVTTWGAHAATTRFRGFVDAGDFLRCAAELTADPRFETMAFFVADFLEATGHAIDTPSVRDDLAAQALGSRSTNTRYRIVVIANDASLEAFTGKMSAMFADGGPEIALFRTREDAARWMDDHPPAPTFRTTHY